MRKTVTTALFATLILLFATAGTALAQQDVSGTVTDAADNQPIPGVNIVVEGTTTGTTTDVEGQYSLTVPGPDATLVFSFVGYQSESVTVGDQSTINVQLQEDVAALDEVVVTGYGTQRRRDISGSVSSVDVAEANTGQVTSPQDLIQGRVAGVNILENSGEPGSGVNVRIRGTTSISAGSDPLYVVDGVPISSTNITPGGSSAGGVTASSSTNPLALINPNDIESIEVLKDAAATSIYGSQGANGVILVTTKGGQEGTVQVDYSGKVSAGVFARKLDLLSAEEYSEAAGEGVGGSTDWQDESTRSTLAQEHNLSLSGGSENTTYRASLGYLDQPGLMEDSGIERVNGRVNASHSIFDDQVRFNLNLTASYFKRNHAFFNQRGGFEGGAIKGMIAFDPRRPLRTDGEFTEYANNIRNPVALLSRIQDITDQNRIIGNFSTEVDLLEGLTAKGTFGVDVGDAIRRSYIPGAGPAQWIGQSFNGLALQAERNLSNIVAQSTLQYNTSIGESQTINAIGGFEYQREVYQEVGTEVRDFVADALEFNNLGAGTAVQPSFSNKQEVTLLSFFGRANYNLQDKYLLTATVRRDGSSVFGENERFAWFPSGSVAWRISNEPFMQNVGWLSELKLRASYGLAGNQAVPPYRALATLSPSADNKVPYGTGEEDVIGVVPERAASPDLKWEQTAEFNVGLDFLAGRFDGALDFYQRTTDDLLLEVRVPPPSFSEFVLQNVGSVENTGVEFSLSALVFDRQNWEFSLGGNISSNRNEITDLGDRGFIDHSEVAGAGQTGVFAQRLEAGHPIGAFYGPVFTGINGAGEETYRTEDGGTTTELGDAERTYIGNAVPDFTYGVNLDLQYGDFDFSAFFRGSQGSEVFNNTALEFTTKSNLGQGINVLEDALTDGTNDEHVPVYSSRWIEDASFFRLDRLTLGYNVPSGVTNYLRRARIYASARNLFVLTPYSGYDPEVNTNFTGQDLGFRTLARPSRGIDYTSYPRSRTFTLGVELGF
jgi:iron complex outermembrane receptor protein